VRAPAGWLAHRLSAWTDERGKPLPSLGVAAAGAEHARRAETAHRQADRAEHDARAAADRAFGQLIRDAAGRRYPTLVQTVLGHHTGGRLMPAAAAEALTRQAIRELLPGGQTEDRHAVAAVIEELLGRE
jgi:hypothetical protein